MRAGLHLDHRRRDEVGGTGRARQSAGGRPSETQSWRLGAVVVDDRVQVLVPRPANSRMLSITSRGSPGPPLICASMSSRERDSALAADGLLGGSIWRTARGRPGVGTPATCEAHEVQRLQLPQPGLSDPAVGGPHQATLPTPRLRNVQNTTTSKSVRPSKLPNRGPVSWPLPVTKPGGVLTRSLPPPNPPALNRG